MNTNLLSETAAPDGVTTETRGIFAALFTAVLLALRKHHKGKATAKPEPMSRADFYAESAALKDHIHAGHLAILEKLDANHRELHAALERQANRISALETGLARVDERTRQ